MKYFIIIFSFLILSPFVVHADNIKYYSLEPINVNGVEYVAGEEIITGNLGGYLNNMFMLGIALCSGLAVIMIIIGGIQYVSTDAWSKKGEGKERIIAAIFGLLIALGSYALLNTINPDILNNTELELTQVKLEGISVETPRPETGVGTGRNIEFVEPNPANSSQPGLSGQRFTKEELNQKMLEYVRSGGLTGLNPSDAARYFPNGESDEAWSNLFAAIAKKESNYNPNLTYTENFKDANGNNVISTGLLQISQESARAYGFPGITTEQLKDPETNLRVGVAIMKKWVAQDGCISCQDSKGRWRGGARYWSTLRK